MSRALQLIARGALDQGSVEDLAARLGIGARQLTRLFDQHLGVAPAAVATTQRLHVAKKLIDETRMPMSEVCCAAGFSSVRRFNAVFQQVYGRTPISLRREEKSGDAVSQEVPRGIQMRLSHRPPFDWRAMLSYLATRAIPGVEHVTADTYSRTIMLNGEAGELSVHFNAASHSLLLTIHIGQTRALQQLVERVCVMFDLKAVSSDIESFLGADPQLGPIVAAHPGIRVPVAWDGFEVAVRAIIGQQVPVKGATTLVSRLAQAYGAEYAGQDNPALKRILPTPAALVDASLSGLGITSRRIAAIRELASAVCAGELRFDGSMDTPAFVERIV